MSYTKKIWKTGDVITAADLNNLEEGASANASAIAEVEKELPSYVGADVPRKAAETITPGTENQTIAAHQYLTGAQTIEGDRNLSAGNIKSGVSIFGVTGTLEAGSTGTDTSDATATAGDILNGKTAYVKGEKVTGTISSKSAATYTPGTSNQTIAAGQYLAGAQTIEGDANLIADNIKNGVSIFGVSGTLEAGSTGTDTSDATATAGDILYGETAYVRGEKVTGTIQSIGARTITPSVNDKEIQAGYYLKGNQIIKGDANLLADNIKKGVSIFGVTGTLEAGSTSTDKTGKGAYIWEKRDEKIWWVESKGNKLSSKPSGYGTTEYKSRTITDDGYYSLSNSEISLDVYYLPTGATNGKTKTILYKPYSAFRASYYVCTLSDEKGKTGKKGDTILGYISADSESAYPNSGLQDDVFYTLINTPDVDVTADKMLDGTVACCQSGKVIGTISKKASATITPGTADQTISSGQYLSGAQTIKGDANLIAGNIKSGVSIFGVTGTLEAGSTGTDTSDATATAGDILNGKTAYVKGTKVTGTISKKAAATITPGTADQTIASGQYLSGTQTIEGDANLIADNIKKGVSIFGVTGTLESGGTGGASTNNCEAYLITSTTQTVSFKNTGGTLKVWGYATQTSSSSWGGSTTKLLAFDGDKYYTSTSYGSPSSTSLSLSLNSDGTISGLPTLASCSLLVTMGV